jgi:hypothetical protein
MISAPCKPEKYSEIGREEYGFLPVGEPIGLRMADFNVSPLRMV